MSDYLPFTFIEEKIKDLENALFYSQSDSILKIPTTVVKILETDALGQLWFIVPKPSQSIHAFDKVFPVELDFFRKGRNFFLKIFGKAFLVNDPEEINMAECLREATKQQARNNEAILIRVQISIAEYVESVPERLNTKNIIHQVKSKIYRWFLSPHQELPTHSGKIPAQVRFPSSFSALN